MSKDKIVWEIGDNRNWSFRIRTTPAFFFDFPSYEHYHVSYLNINILWFELCVRFEDNKHD